MPSRAVTVHLNYDQSKKFVHLPSGESQKLQKEAILRESRNKFRIKGLSTVFLRGGIPIEDAEPSLSRSATQVWVGKGEPFSGPPLDATRSTNPGEVRVIKWVSSVIYCRGGGC